MHSSFTQPQSDSDNSGTALLRFQRGESLAMAGEKKKREAGVASKPSLEMAFDPIGAALRQIHHNIAAEVIPEEFLRLLDKLSDTGAKRSPK